MLVGRSEAGYGRNFIVVSVGLLLQVGVEGERIWQRLSVAYIKAFLPFLRSYVRVKLLRSQNAVRGRLHAFNVIKISLTRGIVSYLGSLNGDSIAHCVTARRDLFLILLTHLDGVFSVIAVILG